MNFLLLLFKCYIVGIISTLGVGPIFILIFRRSAVYGFWRGFVSSIGAALADGFLFFLGLMGILPLLAGSKYLLIALDLIGGIFLIGLGIHSFVKKINPRALGVSLEKRLIRLPLKPFFMTVINPMMIAFFAFWGTQVLPEGRLFLSLKSIMAGSLMVTVGTFTGLTVVSLIASIVGLSFAERTLGRLVHLTGIPFIIIGGYFLYDFSLSLLNLWIS